MTAQHRVYHRTRGLKSRDFDEHPDKGLHVAIDSKHAHRSSPCLGTRLSNVVSRRYSASEIGGPFMSRSAAMAELGELSKKVRTSCFSADRLASPGFAAGKYTYRGPSYARPRRPRSIMMSSSLRTLEPPGASGSSDLISSAVARLRR